MNKRNLLMMTILIIGAFVLVACSGASAQASQTSSDTATSQGPSGEGAQGNGGQGGLPTQMMLAAGTLKLEDTDLAVTAKQAAELLPLWKAARSLVDSDNITREEINAIYDQIEETMTPDQMSAIEAMNLTFEDLREVFPDMQIGGGQFGNFDRQAMQATREAMGDNFQPPDGFAGGDGPRGGFPGGDGGGGPQGGFGGGGNFGNNNSDSGNSVSPTTTIYDPVIDLLESKLE